MLKRFFMILAILSFLFPLATNVKLRSQATVTEFSVIIPTSDSPGVNHDPRVKILQVGLIPAEGFDYDDLDEIEFVFAGSRHQSYLLCIVVVNWGFNVKQNVDISFHMRYADGGGVWGRNFEVTLNPGELKYIIYPADYTSANNGLYTFEAWMRRVAGGNQNFVMTHVYLHE